MPLAGKEATCMKQFERRGRPLLAVADTEDSRTELLKDCHGRAVETGKRHKAAR